MGAGIGAYVALCWRESPRACPGALLLPGPGLEGGGAAPDPATDTHARWADLGARSPAPTRPCGGSSETPAPRLRRGVRAVRPATAALGGRAAPPPWWEALRACATAEPAPGELAGGLARLAGVVRDAPQRAG